MVAHRPLCHSKKTLLGCGGLRGRGRDGGEEGPVCTGFPTRVSAPPHGLRWLPAKRPRCDVPPHSPGHDVSGDRHRLVTVPPARLKTTLRCFPCARPSLKNSLQEENPPHPTAP